MFISKCSAQINFTKPQTKYYCDSNKPLINYQRKDAKHDICDERESKNQERILIIAQNIQLVMYRCSIVAKHQTSRSCVILIQTELAVLD